MVLIELYNYSDPVEDPISNIQIGIPQVKSRQTTNLNFHLRMLLLRKSSSSALTIFARSDDNCEKSSSRWGLPHIMSSNRDGLARWIRRWLPILWAGVQIALRPVVRLGTYIPCNPSVWEADSELVVHLRKYLRWELDALLR